MASEQFHFVITKDSVSVRLDVKPRTRFYALGFFILFVALMMFVLIFAPGKHGNPSMWHDMSMSPIDSPGFMFPLFILVGMAIFLFVLQRRYVMYAYPSAETFSCNRTTLTISKVRWLDIHNGSWVTRSYSIAELEDVRYRVIARSKGAAIYGLRFNTSIDTHRVLPGIEPHDAHKVLMALKSFGADVPDDPKLQRKVEEVHA
jgi:hypothetical protein